MDYRDEEYLNLFKQVKEQRIVETDYSFEQLRGNATNFNRSNEMLKETPNYADYSKFRGYNEPNINEVQRNNYSQDFNVNEFIIETRVNGENINEVRRQGKEDRLNEVMEHLRQERLNEVKKTQETKNLNETVNFNDVDYVTLEMFDKARYNSMMKVARILG
jgi:hypothetical protein